MARRKKATMEQTRGQCEHVDETSRDKQIKMADGGWPMLRGAEMRGEGGGCFRRCDSRI